MSNYFGNVMPNNLVSAANDIFGAVAVAAAAMSSNQQQQVPQQSVPQQAQLGPQQQQMLQNANNNDLLGLQHQQNGSLFDERFSMAYDRKSQIPSNTNTNTSTPNSYASLAGFPHLASPIHQPAHVNHHVSLQTNNLMGSVSSSASSSSQFASMSSSSSPDYMNPYKQSNNQILDLNHHPHMQPHQQTLQQQPQQHNSIPGQHLSNNQHINQLNGMNNQSNQSHLMSPHQAAAFGQQMPQMNQMAPPNLIYPWMRPAANIKASKFTGFDHKRTRQTYSRHQTLELEKEFHYNRYREFLV